MSTIKRILDKKFYVLPLDDENITTQATDSGETLTFLRPPDYFNHITKREENDNEYRWSNSE